MHDEAVENCGNWQADEHHHRHPEKLGALCLKEGALSVCDSQSTICPRNWNSVTSPMPMSMVSVRHRRKPGSGRPRIMQQNAKRPARRNIGFLARKGLSCPFTPAKHDCSRTSTVDCHRHAANAADRYGSECRKNEAVVARNELKRGTLKTAAQKAWKFTTASRQGGECSIQSSFQPPFQLWST